MSIIIKEDRVAIERAINHSISILPMRNLPPSWAVVFHDPECGCAAPDPEELLIDLIDEFFWVWKVSGSRKGVAAFKVLYEVA